MTQQKKLRSVFRMLTLNPVWRVLRHIDYLDDHVVIADKVDKENFALLLENIKRTARRLRVYQLIRIMLLAMLYVSFVLAIGQILDEFIPLVSFVLTPLIAFASFLGFGVLTLLVLLFSRIIHVVEFDLMIEHAHIVAIAVKHNKKHVVHPTYKFGLFMVYEDVDD